MSYKCFCCGKITASPKGLGQHISKTHKMAREEYAKLTLTMTYCTCGNNGKFISICKGWSTWCSACETKRRSESAKKSKALLRMNPEKYAHFVNATSIAVKLQWDNKHQANRIKNMGAAVKVAASKMSQKERSVKFGWMNNEKVTPERKRQVWELSLKAWFDGLSEEQKREFHSNRADKIMKSEKQYLRRMYDNNQSSNAKCNAWTLNLYKCDFFKLDFNKIFGTE